MPLRHALVAEQMPDNCMVVLLNHVILTRLSYLLVLYLYHLYSFKSYILSRILCSN
jgi:hypothetical protein